MKFNLILLSLVLGLLIFACDTAPKANLSPNGHEYEILVDKGGEKPKPGDFVYFQGYIYVGDEMVNSSREMGQEPFLQIPSAEQGADPNAGPVGELLSLLGVGDSARVKVYMDSLAQPIPGYETAEFFWYYLAPLSIKTEAEFKTEQEADMAKQREAMAAVIAREPEIRGFAEDIRQQYLAGSLEGVESTETGLKYVVHDQGSGSKAEPGRVVSVHYLGMLTDGTIFDQSFQRGEPISFPLAAGRVIPGWDEGLLLLNEGAKATFFIPAALAYGAEGREPNIPGNSELIFYIELEKVQ